MNSHFSKFSGKGNDENPMFSPPTSGQIAIDMSFAGVASCSFTSFRVFIVRPTSSFSESRRYLFFKRSGP
jgi:hypothetical protein